jgi:lipopolysaccharide biosynthesis regulator YciM
MVWASEFSWLLWALPLGLAGFIGLGWWLRGYEQRQWQSSRKAGPQAYFRGLSHLLNERQDEAIDAFIEATQHDAETSELHFALGNLFRRRGDYDRAIRVHEHLLQRGDLKTADRQRAQHELALDFLKAGLLDRAETAMQRLLETPLADEARLALLGIYERARDWPQASVTAAQLNGRSAGSFNSRLAHHQCEMAQDALRRGDDAQAEQHLHAALHELPHHSRALMDLSALQAQQGHLAAALNTLLRCAESQPRSLPLLAKRLASLAQQLPDRRDQVLDLLSQAHAQAASVDVTLALLTLDPARRGHWLSSHLSRELSLCIAAEALQDQADLPAHSLQAVKHAASPLQRYRCAACGFETHAYFWQCPGCQSWDSFPARRAEEL